MPDLPLPTPRLILEPLVRAHAALLYPGLRDPALYTFLPKDPPASVEALAARFERLESRTSPDGRERWLNWAARLAAPEPSPAAAPASTSAAAASLPSAPPDSATASQYIGQFEATIAADGTASIAYFIFANAQRTGYGAEGAGAVVAYLFAEGVSAVRAFLDTRNAASRKLVERLGFRRERILENADHFRGSPSDEYVYRRDRPAG